MIPTEHNINISYNERRPIDQEEVIIGGVTQSVIVYSIPYYLAYIHNLKIGAEGNTPQEALSNLISKL